jgi:hypothetical protein
MLGQWQPKLERFGVIPADVGNSRIFKRPSQGGPAQKKRQTQNRNPQSSFHAASINNISRCLSRQVQQNLIRR